MSIVYQCLFCGQGVAPGELDPCALVLAARIDRDRAEQKEQTFYCHLTCLIGRSALAAGTFYITDSDFPTVGEIYADDDRATETEPWSSTVNAAVVREPSTAPLPACGRTGGLARVPIRPVGRGRSPRGGPAPVPTVAPASPCAR